MQIIPSGKFYAQKVAYYTSLYYDIIMEKCYNYTQHNATINFKFFAVLCSEWLSAKALIAK